MPITTTVALQVTTVETLDGNPDSADPAQRKITHAAFNETLTLGATSNPVAQKHAAFVKALVAGAVTIDLTALTAANGAVLDATGLKLQALKVKNLGANNLTINTGAVNGYNFGGSRIVYPGGTEVIYANGALPAVSATVKTIDLTGTGTQTSQWTLILG